MCEVLDRTDIYLWDLDLGATSNPILLNICCHWCVCVCVSMCLCKCVPMSLSLYVLICGCQRILWTLFFSIFHLEFNWDRVSELELRKSNRWPASPRDLFVSAISMWDLNAYTSCLVLSHVCLAVELRSSCSHSQYFSDYTISPVLFFFHACVSFLCMCPWTFLCVNPGAHKPQSTYKGQRALTYHFWPSTLRQGLFFLVFQLHMSS